mgnify:CR=1 FL=1
MNYAIYTAAIILAAFCGWDLPFTCYSGVMVSVWLAYFAGSQS